MKEFNLELLLSVFKKYILIFFALFLLSIMIAFYIIYNQDINYISKKSLLSNNYENDPIITNLNKKLTSMNNIQNLVNDQFVFLKRLSDNSDDRWIKNMEHMNNDKLFDLFAELDEEFFTNNFILDQYYKVLSTQNLVLKIKQILKEENRIPSDLLDAIDGIEFSTKNYFLEGKVFSLSLKHTKYIEHEYLDIFFKSLYEYANEFVKENLLNIYTLHKLNYDQSLKSSISLLKSYLENFNAFQEKLNSQLLKKLENEIEYAKMIDQEWPFDNNMELSGFTYSYVQGYRILEKEYERLTKNDMPNRIFLSYEFVLRSLENMIDQIDINYQSLEDILEYNKNIQFMELRTDQSYNNAIKARDSFVVYAVLIIISQILAAFISLFLFSLKRK